MHYAFFRQSVAGASVSELGANDHYQLRPHPHPWHISPVVYNGTGKLQTDNAWQGVYLPPDYGYCCRDRGEPRAPIHPHRYLVDSRGIHLCVQPLLCV